MEDKIQSKLDAFKRKWGKLILCSSDKNYDWLPAFFMRIQYFKDQLTEKVVRESVCDGKHDGGFDAVFANPNPESKEVVIVQSKCYKGSISPEYLAKELAKIGKTLKEFRDDNVPQIRSERVKDAFRLAHRNIKDGDGVSYVVDFVTNWCPSESAEEKLKAVVRKLDVKLRNCGIESVRLYFGSDLLELAEHWREEPELVSHDHFKLYPGKENVRLDFGDSTIVNLSARSLRDVFVNRNVGMLGLNLRYHVRRNRLHRDVDDGIENTIKYHSERFWLLNNGITVVCEDFKVGKGRKGPRLDLYNYSVVNGGQTTYNIRCHLGKDSTIDFPVICKIVKVKDINSATGKKFAQEVAVSANSQKPIERSALIANNIEQRKLEHALLEYGVFYRRKDGDRPNHKQCKWNESIEGIGKIGLAGFLLMPTAARNNLQLMFEEPYYGMIFSNEHARLYSQLLTVRDNYMSFRRRYGSGRKPCWCKDKDEQRIVALGLTSVIASVSFVARLISKKISKRSFSSSTKSIKDYAKYCGDCSTAINKLSDGIVSACECDDKSGNLLFKKLVRAIYRGYLDYLKKSEESDNSDIDGFMKDAWSFPRFVAPKLIRLSAQKSFRRMLGLS